MTQSPRWVLTCALIAGLAVIVGLHFETLMSIGAKWVNDTSYSHGFLVVPIACWLAWHSRSAWMSVDWCPSWLGVLALLLITGSWVIAKGTGVLVIEQLAVVAMIPALVLAILGGRVTRILAFPLAFLIFAVPFGRALVPWMMQLTADIATWGLKLSGIPVYRSHMYISIPSGTFEVARACSGLNYFITGLVLGVLYAYLTYNSWRKRALCVLAFFVIPVLANGLRVYFTIGTAHLTRMRFGPGEEHITFGRILFVIVVVMMFWIGRRWHDDVTPDSAEPKSPAGRVRPGKALIPLPFVLLVLIAGPTYLASSAARANAQLREPAKVIGLPAGAAGWRGPLEDVRPWRPLYHGARIEKAGVYRAANGSDVSVFVGVYGLGTSLGAEMISYDNQITDSEKKSLPDDTGQEVWLTGGRNFSVREQLVRESNGQYLVWYWFRVGNRLSANEFVVKGLEALAFVTRGAAAEQVITLATPFDEAARERLQSFITAHGTCIGAGFSAEACRR